MKTRIQFALFLILLCYTAGLSAQEQYMFKHIAAKDGLSHSQVNCIFKDSRGFMWFATAGGLNRYDGYHYKVYRSNENDTLSIADNLIENIQEDYAGFLWVYTGAGYVRYNPQTETFARDFSSFRKQMGMKSVPTLVYIDNQKNYWLYAPGEGGFCYNPLTKKVITCLHGDNGLSEGTVVAIRDSKTAILFLFDDGSIDFIDKETGKVLRRDTYLRTHAGIVSGKYSLRVDRDNDIWVYSRTAAGVWVCDSRTNTWTLYDNSPRSTPYRLSSNVIQDIAEDNGGKIWLATDHGGVNIINKSTGQLTVLLNNVADERTISNNSINCIYCDNVNTLWLGSYKKGISYYNESIYKFGVDHLSSLRRLKNFDSDVTFLETGKDELLWIGTNGSGLIRMDRKTGEKQLFEHQPNQPNSLSSDVIVSLCAARDGRVWIGTYLGGMDCFDGHRFVHYRPNPDNPNSLANDNIWSIVEDEEGMIWIGTLGGGLQRLNPATGQFTTYATQLGSPFVTSLCMGRESVLYIGTAVGITIYDRKKGTFEKLEGNRAGTQRFSNQNVNQIYEDSRGLLWIVTRDGLNVYDRRNDHITSLHRADGLPDDFMCAIIEDSNKNMWLTTPNGVSNIVVNTDPKSGSYRYSFYNYDEMDGLQDREFNMRSITRTFRGDILMGGIRGFNILRPDAIKYNHILPEVKFTGLTLFNEEVKIGQEYNGNLILSEALNLIDCIELKYGQNVFTVAFSGMNYILPEKARFAYMLEGFNTDWLIAEGSMHEVTYTNLAPGTYTLKVKAANSDGYWNDKATSLTIVVHPPFWRSAWAYLLYTLMIIGILYYASMQIKNRERAKFKIKQVELEAARMHELDDMKLRFFTSVSHEFRTPLTLILAPMEYLISHTENAESKQKLTLVRRNALRLLNLVNELLDFRKGDVSSHRLNATTGDAIAFLRGICQSFMELSEKKNIRFSFLPRIESCPMDFDEDKLGRVLLNLLSNAFKFTPEGGNVVVQASMIPATDTQPEQLEVRVADNGIGVSDENKERIFERFFQVQQSSSENQGGSGIGLHLVKEFVMLHGGDIHVEDNPGRGSVFVFTINNLSENRVEEVPAVEENPATEILQDWVSVSAVEAPAVTEEGANGSPLILLVEDNDDFRSFLSDSLRGHFRICEAANGLEAWKMIPELQPDLIISDVMMPEMDGCELCRLVKNDIRTSHIPLILLTARTAEEQKVEGLSEGADDYITKPFNFEILMLRIRKLIEQGEKKREQFNKQIEPNPSEITITSLDEKLIAKAIKYVEDNIGRSELSVEEMSRELGMSRVHLYKKLLTITGKSPIEFIRVIRLKRAAQLLRESQMNVSEIAYEVGFNNPKYFSKYFKEEFGKLPSEYKNTN